VFGSRIGRLTLAVGCAVVLIACGAPPRRFAAPSATPSALSPSPSTSAPASPSAAASPVIPPGVVAGIAVYDRQTATFTEAHNATTRFRSASLVKLLIALDYLWDRRPGYVVAPADRAWFDLMLRSSDDSAASYFWGRAGSGAVVSRMVSRLGLKDTSPPPPDRSGWGSTAVSAADLVRVYRYLLDTAPAPVRELVMGDLHRSTRCGTDGFDQSFGIPSVFPKPWSAKQGWYEFGGVPAVRCVENAAYTGPDYTGPVGASARVIPAGNAVDYAGEVLHTTGTVGEGDRTIVVVLTLHRHGIPFATASSAVTNLVAGLPVPR
jgi:hypothetical protein